MQSGEDDSKTGEVKKPSRSSRLRRFAANAYRKARQKASGASSTVAVSVKNIGKSIDEALSDAPEKMRHAMSDMRTKFKEAANQMEAAYARQKLKAKISVIRKMEAYFRKLLDQKLKPEVRDVVVDPDMPGCVKNTAEELVEAAWPHVKEEVWDIYQNAVLDFEDIPEGETPGCCSSNPRNNGFTLCCGPLNLIRAVILFTMFPFNKSFWGKLRSPLWYLFTLISACPLYGVQAFWFFITFLMHDKRDEFILTMFILGFKGMQFITLGVISGLTGAIMYYNCVNHNTSDPVGGKFTHNCDDRGPAQRPAFYIDGAAFLLQVVLVWAAWAYLPFSQKFGYRRTKPGSAPRSWVDEAHRAEDHYENENNTGGCCSRRSYRKKGSHLWHLMIYDLIVFFVCVILLVIAVFTRKYNILDGADGASETPFEKWEWQFRSDVYWVRTLYGLLSFPFLFASLPMLNRFLLHVRPTGYNKAGVVVPAMSRKEFLEQEERRTTSGGDVEMGGAGTPPQVEEVAGFTPEVLEELLESDDEDDELEEELMAMERKVQV